MVPRYMNGQDPLGEIRVADRADDPDSVVFIGKDGAVVFLDGDHRFLESVQHRSGDVRRRRDGSSLRGSGPRLHRAFLINDVNAAWVNGGLYRALRTALDCGLREALTR